jgi:hypothetical protein
MLREEVAQQDSDPTTINDVGRRAGIKIKDNARWLLNFWVAVQERVYFYAANLCRPHQRLFICDVDVVNVGLFVYTGTAKVLIDLGQLHGMDLSA